MKRIKNMLNAHEFPYFGKVITMPSETIPDQTLSIKEILERYARGLPLDARTPQWDENANIDDDFLPDPRILDLSERQELAESAKAELFEIKSKIKEKQTKKVIIEPEITNPPAQLEN